MPKTPLEWSNPEYRRIRDAMSAAQANADRDQIAWAVYAVKGTFYIATKPPGFAATHWCYPARCATA